MAAFAAAADSDTEASQCVGGGGGGTCTYSAERSMRRASRSCTSASMSQQSVGTGGVDPTCNLPCADWLHSHNSHFRCDSALGSGPNCTDVRVLAPERWTGSHPCSQTAHTSLARARTQQPSTTPSMCGQLRVTAAPYTETALWTKHNQPNGHLMLQDACLQAVEARRVPVVVPASQPTKTTGPARPSLPGAHLRMRRGVWCAPVTMQPCAQQRVLCCPWAASQGCRALAKWERYRNWCPLERARMSITWPSCDQITADTSATGTWAPRWSQRDWRA